MVATVEEIPVPTPERPTHEMHEEARTPSNRRSWHVWLSGAIVIAASLALLVAVMLRG